MAKPEPLQYGLYYHIYNRGNSSESLFREKRTYPSRAFANLFGTYTKAFSKSYQRTGSLFEKPFRRKLVDNDRYFTALVAYIHRNPQTHGFVADFRDWPYASYQAIVSDKPTRVQREIILDWFNGRIRFEDLHRADADETIIKPLIGDDFA